MDIHFQDRIDDFLLNRMDEAQKRAFLREVEADEEKKEQLEFTRHVKESIASRAEKLRALAEFRQAYEEEQGVAAASEKPKNRVGWWLSGIAALLVVCFFAIKPMSGGKDASVEGGHPAGVRRVNKALKSCPADSTGRDTIPNRQKYVIKKNQK